MKIEGLNITDQINTKYRDYALYIIQSRGIPNFYDSLTPVQRLIMINAPKSYNKTIGLVGEVIKTGLYHHGDSSLSSAINKLARPFGCAEQLLLGDGFFGTPVNPEASAARYTSVRVNPEMRKIIDENWNINAKNLEGGYEWINVKTPIGLLTHVVGIAVGYRSNILPRKRSDIEEYLDGADKQLKPYFKDFNGKITRNRKLNSAWLIEGEITVDEKRKEIRIGDLPPLIRYDSYLKRLYTKIDEEQGNVRISNNSSTRTDITITYKGNNWTDFSRWVLNSTKVIVSENLVFIRGGAVVEYKDISQYLDEFRVHREGIILRNMKYDLDVLDDELEFQEAKLKFLEFMIAKKRKDSEVKKWMSDYKPDIRRRLDTIKLTSLTQEHIDETKEEIKRIKKAIEAKKKEIITQEKKYKDFSKKVKWKAPEVKEASVLGDEEIESIDGISVWKGYEEPVEEEAEENETTEEL